MPSDQPFMYAPEWRNSERFPTTTFDPKAVTRASWAPKPERPVQTGPLVSFNRHPDSHMALPARSNLFAPLGRKTKGAIKWSRRFQWFFRVLEFNGALGILIMFCLFKDLSAATAWIMRVATAFAIGHTIYGIYHHSRGATGRTPASSAAYQVFASVSDLVVLSVYAYGAYTMHQKSASWTSRVSDQNMVDKYFIPGTYYGIVGAGGLHVLSLLISLWLGYMFQKISDMPPDMNPLEDHLTARPSSYRKSKASLYTTTTADSDRMSMAESNARYSTPQVPFMHTRTGSTPSINSHDSRVNLPSRQYQIMSSNSARNSAISLATKHTSMSPVSKRGSYMEVPATELSPPPRQSMYMNGGNMNLNTRSQDRLPNYSHPWMAADSLTSRSNQRNREQAAEQAGRQARTSKSYSALNQRYNLEDSEDEEDITEQSENSHHPNPLRSHPPPEEKTTYRPWTAANLSANSALSEISNNGRLVASAGGDSRSLTHGLAPRPRDSSIQADAMFTRQSLKIAPVTIGSGRKVSSGNDFAVLQAGAERRRVSGKVVEEGLGGF